MFEENPEIIIDNMDNPRYVNSLRVKYEQEESKGNVNFAYDYDPVPGSKKGQGQGGFSMPPQP